MYVCMYVYMNACILLPNLHAPLLWSNIKCIGFYLFYVLWYIYLNYSLLSFFQDGECFMSLNCSDRFKFSKFKLLANFEKFVL
ncbi:hypothetical protein C0J52_26174 [Blattella germanica]|nr:hypothetical protein C0J52_26174 [Blattella germanica]